MPQGLQNLLSWGIPTNIQQGLGFTTVDGEFYTGILLLCLSFVPQKRLTQRLSSCYPEMAFPSAVMDEVWRFVTPATSSLVHLS